MLPRTEKTQPETTPSPSQAPQPISLTSIPGLPAPNPERDKLVALFPNEAPIWQPMIESIELTAVESPAETIEELYLRNRSRPAAIRPASESHNLPNVQHGTPDLQQKKLSFWQKCKNIFTPAVHPKIDTPLTQSSLDQIRTISASRSTKNTKKSTIWKNILKPFTSAKNTLALI